MNLRVARLVGDPIARGRAHGAAFAEPIRRYAAERVHLATNGSWAGRPVSTADVLGLAEQMVPAHRDYAPDVFAEMVAMADAAGISVPEAIIVGGFTDFVDAVRGAAAADRAEDDCTAVLVPDSRAEAGHGWLAQTWDMHDTATEHVVVLEIAPEGGPAATVFTTVGCVAQIGMNAHGVAVGINNLTANDGRVGVTWPFVVRRMLAESTADAAIACVTEATLAGGHDYLVLDAHGAGANLEAMPTHTAVTRLRADVLAHTNHALDPETLQRQAARPPALQQSSIDRLDRALSRTREGVLTRQALFDLTADPVICRDSEAPFHMETSGAVAMCPRTRELWAVWRSPARHTWQRFVVGGAGSVAMTLQTLRLGVSATVFLGLLAWMQAGPVVTQVFGKKLLFGTMAWQMYHGKGIQQCIVRWSDGATGEEVESPPLQPRRRKHYTNEKEVLREARSRCSDGVDLRATVWCGRRPEGHWKELLTVERVLCP